jgi:hypothetical protein
MYPQKSNIIYLNEIYIHNKNNKLNERSIINRNEIKLINHLNNLNDLNNMNEMNDLNSMDEITKYNNNEVSNEIDEIYDLDEVNNNILFNYNQEIKYEYKGLKLLNKNLNDITKYKNLKYSSNIIFIPYHITKNEELPFIQIFLNKKTDNKNNLEFLQFNYKDETIFKNEKSMFDFMFYIMDKLIENNISHNYNTNIKELFKGYKVYDDRLYLFFDVSNINIDNFYISNNDLLWFCSYDEIINHNKICNFLIDKNVVNFFNHNIDFLQIINISTQEIYDYPNILYTGNTIQKSKFENIFGNVKQENCFGDYYNFTTYNEAVKNSLKKLTSIEENENYVGGGIVRYAVFLKEINYIIDDNSFNNFEKINNWNIKYDSLFINYKNLKFNIVNYPCWIIKSYTQQYPLTYHITKTNINDLDNYKNNNFDNFYII